MTVNYFESRHHQSIEEYRRDNSELVNQDARIVWASLISSVEVSRYDCLFHDCPLAGNTRRVSYAAKVCFKRRQARAKMS